MLLKTKGIILKSIRYRDTSVILDIFTSELGYKTYIVNGVYKPKPTIHPSLVQLGSLLDLVVYNRENKSMNRIKDIKQIKYPNLSLSRFDRLAIKLFVIELAQKVLRNDDGANEFFDTLESALILIEESPQAMGNMPILFCHLMLQHLGLSPIMEIDEEKKFLNIEDGCLDFKYNRETHLNAEQTLAWLYLTQSDLSNFYTLNISGPVKRQLLRNMLRYFAYHIDHFPQLNTVEVYQKIL